MRSDPTMISCPACAGVLRAEVGQQGHIEFICSVGHAFSLEGLYQAKEEQVELFEWSVVALMKHLQMVLGLLLESGPTSEAYQETTIQRRLTQVSGQITLVEQIIHQTECALREEPAGVTEAFPNEGS